MRSSVAAWAFALLSLQGANALNGAISRKLSQLAEMGLLPDGTPMGSDQTGDSMSTFSIAPPVAAPATAETIVEEYVKLPLNNFARNNNFDYEGTFYNRFWVSEAAYKAGGPVFLYDAGEADASLGAINRLQNETSFFKQLVDKYNGIGIVWEHRYYGNSTPEPIHINTPPEAFKWLNTEQSLADVDRFAKQFKRKNIKYDLTPNKTPWIFVGGSYPGMRAAFMRDKYPETIFASFASSAPVEAKVDMGVYYEPIWDGMHRYGFGNCSRDIQAAVRYVDKKLGKSDEAAAKIKQQFLGLGAEMNSNDAFGESLTVIFYLWQGYGIDGGRMSLRPFCDWISTDPKTNKTSPAEGWAASKGAAWTAQRWATWPTWVDSVNYYMNSECTGSMTEKTECNLDFRWTDPATISWTWQYCTQWGYFQSINEGEHQLVSKYNSLSHQKYLCHRQFPTATPEDGFPEWPNTDRTNRIFGGWDIRPSNTYWSGGEFDPWRTLSPLSDEPFAPKVREFTNPPKCGDEQDRDEIFGYIMPNAQHCYDFRAESLYPGGAVSRGYFTNALDRWLKCFRPKRGPH